MLDDFLSLVPRELGDRSGAVFYSGRSAFSRASELYILGLNPGGDPGDPASETVLQDIDASLNRRVQDWSAYCARWEGREPGDHGMQPRVRHLLSEVGVTPHEVPASNVVFVRTKREAHLRSEVRALLDQCWPVHQEVINRLGVRIVLCLGRTAGRWVCGKLDATLKVGCFEERNERRWKSYAHANATGVHVLTLTHPSVADWTRAATDPTPLVRASMERVRSA